MFQPQDANQQVRPTDECLFIAIVLITVRSMRPTVRIHQGPGVAPQLMSEYTHASTIIDSKPGVANRKESIYAMTVI